MNRRVDISTLEDKTCLICQDTMTDPIQLSCGHAFCEECIFKWLVQNPTCPLCRSKCIPSKTFVGFNGYTNLLPGEIYF